MEVLSMYADDGDRNETGERSAYMRTFAYVIASAKKGTRERERKNKKKGFDIMAKLDRFSLY